MAAPAVDAGNPWRRSWAKGDRHRGNRSLNSSCSLSACCLMFVGSSFSAGVYFFDGE